MEGADFSGYATKAGLKCSDGRTIASKAFEHMDGKWVPLVWQHGHGEVSNVLGKVFLQHKDDGTYCFAFFNDTSAGVEAKKLVQHGDIDSLSIYANKLVEKSKEVLHGMIREVSLVFAGANPGAKIDFVAMQHSSDPDDITVIEDEAVIFTGINLTLAHSDEDEEETVENDETVDHEDEEDEDETAEDVYDSLTDSQKKVVHFMISKALKGEETNDEVVQHEDAPEETLQDVYNSMSPKQKQVVQYMVGVALEKSAAAQHSDDNSDADTGDASTTNDAGTGTTNEDTLAHQEGSTMTNVFESSATGEKLETAALNHSQLVEIVKKANQPGGSFKEAVLAHAQEYGITDINMLFPEAKALTQTPEFISRRMEWVSKVLGGTRKSPFAKVKTVNADITADEARAKGYVKGSRKVEEVFGLLKRTTGPTTIYKKQKLDRDDVLDITDMDVVAWLKAEMRLMIEEELARAILVGDGRSNMSPDKVKDPAGAQDGDGIRSILHDSDLYVLRTEMPANTAPKDAVKRLVRARTKYRGSGKPTLFISDAELTEMMLEEDRYGRPLYETEAALMDKLRVESIVTVDLFDEYDNLFAIMVSLQDYTIGSNRGGELTSFEDFDIDFNQHKYLQETRLSGGLTKPYSAIVITRAEGTKATATAPSYDGATKTITIPESTGVMYTIDDELVEGDVVIDKTTTVEAEPETGYYLETGSTRDWTYTV